MLHRVFTQMALKGILAAALAVATPALAHDRYYDPYNEHSVHDQRRSYDHHSRDRNQDYRHHLRDGVGGFGHAAGDLLRYGTTNPYSSPGHYYRDQHRAYDHELRDRRRAADRHRRDGHDTYDHDREHRDGSYQPY